MTRFGTGHKSLFNFPLFRLPTSWIYLKNLKKNLEQPVKLFSLQVLVVRTSIKILVR